MLVSRHAIATLILAVILFPIYEFKVLLLFAFGVFIDFDHYLDYVFNTKNFNPIKAYKVHMNEFENNLEVPKKLHLFHVVEFWILILALTLIFKNDYFYMISLGLILHLSMDFIDMFKNHQENSRYLSLIHYFIDK
jgi:hypothetical protein